MKKVRQTLCVAAFMAMAVSVMAGDVTPRNSYTDALGTETYCWTSAVIKTLTTTNATVRDTLTAKTVSATTVTPTTLTVASKNGGTFGGKAPVVSTNAVGGMILSFTTTTNALTVAFPVPFAGTTIPVATAVWQDTLVLDGAGTNSQLRAKAVSNQVVITHGDIPNGGAYTNIGVIVHGVAPGS